MSHDIEECLSHVRAFGSRLKREQHELMSMQSEMDSLLQVVQATLEIGPIPHGDEEKFSLRSPSTSVFGLVPVGRHSVSGHAASTGDFGEGKSGSAAGSIYMARLNPSTSAILDTPFLNNIAGMLDMSIEDALHKHERQLSAIESSQIDRLSIRKSSSTSLLKNFRFSRSSQSRRPSANFDPESKPERVNISSQLLNSAERQETEVLQSRKSLERAYHELVAKQEPQEKYGSLGRRAVSRGGVDRTTHVEIDMQITEDKGDQVNDNVRRKSKSRAGSAFGSENNLKDLDETSELELSEDKGIHVVNRGLQRLRTAGQETHRSDSVASVKFQEQQHPQRSPENDSALSVPRVRNQRQESVMSSSTAGVQSSNLWINNYRNEVVRFLYVPSFTEFGFNISSERGPLKSKSSLLSRDAATYEGFHPFSKGLVYWGAVMFLIHMLVLYEVPVIAAFETKLRSSELSIFLTFAMSMDILINFFTLRLVDGVVEPSIMHARLFYLRSGFFFDILSTIPFDIIFKSSIRYSEAFILIRLLYTRNIAKISKTNAYLMKLSRWIQKTFRIGVSFMRIFLLGGMLLTFLHIHGCIVFFLGKMTGFTGESWRKVSYLFQEAVQNQYIWSLFVATANTFPVTGFQPTDPIEQVIGIILAVIGAVLYACLVGTISSFSFGLDSSGRKYKEKIDEVNEYMTYRNLSDSIKKKVRDYFEMKYKGKFFDEEAILREMNDSLRLEIAVHNCQDLIAKVPFLRREMNDGRDEFFMGRIARALKPKYFVKGDIIFEQGWVGNEMYFILNGSVSIIVNQKVVGNLTDGAFFGEVALLGEVPRTATIRASTNTVLYCLERQDFVTIIADYQDMAVRIKQVYEERMVKVKKENEEKNQQQQVMALTPPKPDPDSNVEPPNGLKVIASAPLQQ
ncbi:hypothetical protein HDU67_009042 [Dinochytrium kinnereticum]|nr:hypothetical protein HDU67_009042 [Dinochytrium kinnereticum]